MSERRSISFEMFSDITDRFFCIGCPVVEVGKCSSEICPIWKRKTSVVHVATKDRISKKMKRGRRPGGGEMKCIQCHNVEAQKDRVFCHGCKEDVLSKKYEELGRWYNDNLFGHDDTGVLRNDLKIRNAILKDIEHIKAEGREA